METAAARERTPPLLAAAVFAGGSDTAPATDPAHWRKTASGVKNWSESTTTWDFNGLGPKTWWGALYYYRARWYEPQTSAFLERDLLEYIDGQNLTAFLAISPPNVSDIDGLQVTWDTATTLEHLSEPLPESHAWLVRRNLANGTYNWYTDTGQNGLAYIRMHPHARDLALNAYSFAIADGTGRFMQPVEKVWHLDPGYPLEDESGRYGGEKLQETNRMWQRMRVFQLERIIDMLLKSQAEDIGTAGEGIFNWRNRKRAGNLIRNEGIFRNRARSFKRQASLELLQKLPVFTRANHWLSVGSAADATSAAISGFVDNRSSGTESGSVETAIRKFKELYGLQLRLLSKREASKPYQSIAPFSWNVDGGEQLWELLKPTGD